MYGLTERTNIKKGKVEITVNIPVDSIIRISVMVSCPEIISFTVGKRIEQANSVHLDSQPNIIGSVYNLTKREIKPVIKSNDDFNESDYLIENKYWFMVPQYSGHAVTAVKLQTLRTLNIADWNGHMHQIDETKPNPVLLSEC